MNCAKCGANIEEDTRFCPDCGTPRFDHTATPRPAGNLTPQAQASRTTKRCPYCGEEILEAAVKCRFCSSDLALTPAAAFLQPRPGASNIVLNAPAAPSAPAMAPSIIIQNVQAQQAPVHPGFVPGMYKNPGLALFLSIIFPGAGQFYNGHVGKGFLVLFTCWLVLPWIWSWFDAYSSAQRINRVGF